MFVRSIKGCFNTWRRASPRGSWASPTKKASWICLCVGYKMKTCTQISDSGFRVKIDVVSPEF